MNVRHVQLALLVAATLLALPVTARSVNILPNPSFETYTSCPTSFGQLNLAPPWDTPNTGTSDYFNACVTGWPPFPVPGVPLSPFGFQTARTGSGFSGLIPYSAAPDYREYLSAPLLAPLVAAQPYTITFYVNLADSASIAIDRIGAYFSVGAVGPVPNYAALPYTPQVESPANVFLTNTTGWTAITGTFVAAGGENYVTIGNFHDDASTNTFNTGGSWPGGAYYMVDDGSVELALPTVQACCTPDGQCSMQYPGECALLGGLPLGPGTTCSGNPCGPTPVQKLTWGSLKGHYRQSN